MADTSSWSYSDLQHRYNLKGIYQGNTGFDVTYLENLVTEAVEKVDIAKTYILNVLETRLAPGGHEHWASDIRLKKDTDPDIAAILADTSLTPEQRRANANDAIKASGLSASVITKGELGVPVTSTSEVVTKFDKASVRASGITNGTNTTWNGITSTEKKAHIFRDAAGQEIGRFEVIADPSGMIRAGVSATNVKSDGSMIHNHFYVGISKDGHIFYEFADNSIQNQSVYVPQSARGFAFLSSGQDQDDVLVEFSPAFASVPIVTLGVQGVQGTAEQFSACRVITKHVTAKGFSIQGYGIPEGVAIKVNWIAMEASNM